MPRFRMQAPLDVTVSRAGTTDVVPGRAVNVCERGLGAMVAGELMPGEMVAIELRVSGINHPVRTYALVRYQDKLRCGLEFALISEEQTAAILEWARTLGAGTLMKQYSGSLLLDTERSAKISSANVTREGGHSGSNDGGPPGKTWKKRRLAVWLLLLAVIAIVAGAFWWKWNRDWEQLEAGLNRPGSAATEMPQAQVPAEVMQKLLIHRVEPVYPAEARKQNLQGVIALDIVVGRDGTVVSMRALNGPEILAKAAMDALRWWKFAPYRLNGVPAVVETTVAVEFKR